MSISLSGRIKTEINHQPCITARDVQVSKKRNQTVHKGAYGKIGRSQGQPDYEISVTFSVPQDQAEFVQLAEQGIDSDTGDGFTFTWYKGSEQYMATDCGISQDNLSSDQDAKADQQVTIVAVNVQRLV
jgi:hypothetical protein